MHCGHDKRTTAAGWWRSSLAALSYLWEATRCALRWERACVARRAQSGVPRMPRPPIRQPTALEGRQVAPPRGQAIPPSRVQSRRHLLLPSEVHALGEVQCADRRSQRVGGCGALLVHARARQAKLVVAACNPPSGETLKQRTQFYPCIGTGTPSPSSQDSGASHTRRLGHHIEALRDKP